MATDVCARWSMEARDRTTSNDSVMQANSSIPTRSLFWAFTNRRNQFQQPPQCQDARGLWAANCVWTGLVYSGVSVFIPNTLNFLAKLIVGPCKTTRVVSGTAIRTSVKQRDHHHSFCANPMFYIN